MFIKLLQIDRIVVQVYFKAMFQIMINEEDMHRGFLRCFYTPSTTWQRRDLRKHSQICQHLNITKRLSAVNINVVRKTRNMIKLANPPTQ